MSKAIFASLLLISIWTNRLCQTEDSIASNPEYALNGLWYLTSIQGGETLINNPFENGIITWEFDAKTNILHVVNNNPSDEGFDGLESGDYPFSIIQFDAILLLEINNASFGSYFIEENQLLIDQNGNTSGVSDGYVLGFRRK